MWLERVLYNPSPRLHDYGHTHTLEDGGKGRRERWLGEKRQSEGGGIERRAGTPVVRGTDMIL